MARNLLSKTIKDIFESARQSLLWKKFQSLPLFLRLICGVMCLIIGILGILTPIPFGTLFLVIGLAIFVGLRRARSYTLGFIHRARIHLLYSRIYTWWNRKK